jgi:hypothetical protein
MHSLFFLEPSIWFFSFVGPLFKNRGLRAGGGGGDREPPTGAGALSPKAHSMLLTPTRNRPDSAEADMAKSSKYADERYREAAFDEDERNTSRATTSASGGVM